MFSPSTNLVRLGFFPLAVLMLHTVPPPTLAQQAKSAEQVPEAVRGAKIYKLPTKGGQPAPNFGIYKKLSFRDINFDRLHLDLSVSIRPVDHPATVEHMYFQDVRVNGVPVQIETFDQEFKLSNKETVDVPAPLECAIIFADLDSLQPVRDMVDKDTILITGKSFIEVKLSTLEKIAFRAKRVVIPVPLNEQVQLNLFQGNPLLHTTAAMVLDNLVNPTSAAAINMAKEHLAKLQLDASLGTKANSAIFLLLTEYTVRDPKSQASEQFSESGTGFLVSADGKMLTAKRVITPWKFDPQVDFLIEHQHMVLDEDSVKTYAWPAGAQVTGTDGQLDFPSALSTDKHSLKILRMPPDEMVKQDYQDADSEERATLHLHAEGLSDLALLQLTGTSFQPLTFADPAISLAADSRLVLCSYPFGASQPQSTPRLLSVQASPQGNAMKIGHKLDPGESGAPLLNTDGKVVALATSMDQSIPVQIAQELFP
ncbi:MAG TPA: serine protease [Terriglobia bacterium]|nr:serine protease [Terriglobia bacterium]